ncbi:sulfite exporter TauE/SafE family protein [Thermodesulfobacteriota bacterium B35]
MQPSNPLCPFLSAMTTFLLAGVIFLAAGFVQGLTGFGSALVAIPLLSLLMDVKAAVPLCILNGLVITGYLMYRLRQDLDHRRILPLLIGSFPGILVGATLLARVDSGCIRAGIGILLISYSLFNLLVRPRPLCPGRAWGYLAGFCTGAIGTAFSAGGPPAIIYTALTDWSKDEIRATLTGFFAANSTLIALVHALTGVTTGTTLAYFACTFFFVLAGTMLGSRLTGRINRSAYLRVVHLFLIAMGAMMLISS